MIVDYMKPVANHTESIKAFIEALNSMMAGVGTFEYAGIRDNSNEPAPKDWVFDKLKLVFKPNYEHDQLNLKALNPAYGGNLAIEVSSFSNFDGLSMFIDTAYVYSDIKTKKRSIPSKGSKLDLKPISELIKTSLFEAESAARRLIVAEQGSKHIAELVNEYDNVDGVRVLNMGDSMSMSADEVDIYIETGVDGNPETSKMMVKGLCMDKVKKIIELAVGGAFEKKD